MFKWFECKVRFEREQQDGAIKSTEEAYLVDAMSFTEAEARITLEMKPFVTSEFEVKNINNVRITEIVNLHEDYSDNKFFKSKVIYKTIDEKKGIEEAARIARYSAFNDIIRGRSDISTIAVAHNMSDNAETVIFNLLRGSGTRGAAGIRPVRDNIVRPLISVNKSDIVAALEYVDFYYVTDSTNTSTYYTRNYIRHKIVPKLAHINDDPERMLKRFSDNARSDDDFITSLAVGFVAERNII